MEPVTLGETETASLGSDKMELAPKRLGEMEPTTLRSSKMEPWPQG